MSDLLLFVAGGIIGAIAMLVLLAIGIGRVFAAFDNADIITVQP